MFVEGALLSAFLVVVDNDPLATALPSLLIAPVRLPSSRRKVTFHSFEFFSQLEHGFVLLFTDQRDRLLNFAAARQHLNNLHSRQGPHWRGGVSTTDTTTTLSQESPPNAPLYISFGINTPSPALIRTLGYSDKQSIHRPDESSVSQEQSCCQKKSWPTMTAR